MASRCAPPAPGTREAEVVARFAAFLRVAGTPAEFDASSPARRYHVRLLAWRVRRA